MSPVNLDHENFQFVRYVIYIYIYYIVDNSSIISDISNKKYNKNKRLAIRIDKMSNKVWKKITGTYVLLNIINE